MKFSTGEIMDVFSGKGKVNRIEVRASHRPDVPQELNRAYSELPRYVPQELNTAYNELPRSIPTPLIPITRSHPITIPKTKKPAKVKDVFVGNPKDFALSEEAEEFLAEKGTQRDNIPTQSIPRSDPIDIPPRAQVKDIFVGNPKDFELSEEAEEFLEENDPQQDNAPTSNRRLGA